MLGRQSGPTNDGELVAQVEVHVERNHPEMAQPARLLELAAWAEKTLVY